MTPVELMAVAIALSLVVAAIAWSTGRLIELGWSDPDLRGRIWGLALYAPALPPLLVGLALLAPPPMAAPAPATAGSVEAAAPTADLPAVAMPAPDISIDWSVLAVPVLIVAGLLATLRLGALVLRARRLNRLVRDAASASARLTAGLETAARALDIPPPALRISAGADDALLTGFSRPVLLLPAALDEARAGAVFAHELAHLKRGDHRTVWFESALLALLAINPLLPPIRDRRAAAREEACDALALTGASDETRRAYADCLIDALRSRAGPPGAPALTFTGARRTFVMRRLKSVLAPAPVASRFARLITLGLGAVLVASAAAGALTVADARQAQNGLVSLDGDRSILRENWPWISAALTPVYQAAWPEACGFGTEDEVFIHLGEGCTSADVPNPRIISLAGVPLAQSPREAFEAVRAACAAQRSVDIRYRSGEVEQTRSVACTNAPVAPPPPVRITLALSATEPVTIAPGDRLWVTLVGASPQGASYRNGKVIDLAPGQPLPREVFADFDHPRMTNSSDPAYVLTAAIIGADQQERMRTVAPVPVRLDSSSAAATLTLTRATTHAAPLHASLGPRHFALTAAELERLANLDGAGFRQACAREEERNGAFCAGVIFAATAREAQAASPRACPPAEPGPLLQGALAAMPDATGDTMNEIAAQALIRAFPCRVRVNGGAPGRTPIAAADIDRIEVDQEAGVVNFIAGALPRI